MHLKEVFSPEELRLLQQRAERIAVPITEDDSSGRVAVLTVIIRQERYAFPIAGVRAVYKEVLTIPVPGVPAFVAGIANIRGHIVSVLDLGALMGLGGLESESGAMLVVDNAGGSIGMHVEAIGEVVELPMSQLNPIPSSMSLEHQEYFQGVFHDGTALLDVRKLLADPRIQVDQSAG